MNLEIRRNGINWHVKRNDLKEIISSLQREGNYWEGQVFLTKRKKEYKLSFRIFLNSNDEDEFDVTDGQLILSISDDTFPCWKNIVLWSVNMARLFHMN